MSDKVINSQPAQSRQLRRSSKFGSVLVKVILYLVLTLWGATTVYPFIWAINNSFKGAARITRDSFSIVNAETFVDNYSTLFARYARGKYGMGELGVWGSYLNSIVIAGSVTIVVIVLASCCAFALSRYRFKGNFALHSLLIAAMMFPAFSTIIPVYMIMLSLGLIDNLLSVILPLIAGNLAFGAIILIGYIRGLPIDLEEAAYLEGCNVYGILFRIVYPISLPAFATVGIFTFLWSYNDLFFANFMFKSTKMHTIPKLIFETASRDFGTDYGIQMAAVTLVVVPVLIVYIFLQRNIIKGLTAGAVKG